MNEYDSSVIGVVCAIFSSRLVNRYFFNKIEYENLADIVKDIRNIGYEDLADIVSRKDHKKIDYYLLRSLIEFIDSISKYLPLKIRQMINLMYFCWFSYFMKIKSEIYKCPIEGILDVPKDRFVVEVEDNIKKLERKFNLNREDSEGISMLVRQILYGESVFVNKEKISSGIWPLIDVISRKVNESKELSKILHSSIIRDEIWKGNLFVK